MGSSESAFAPDRPAIDSPPFKAIELYPLTNVPNSKLDVSPDETDSESGVPPPKPILPFIPPAPVTSRLGLTDQSWIQREPQSMLDQPLHRVEEECSKITKQLQELLDAQAAAIIPGHKTLQQEKAEKQRNNQNGHYKITGSLQYMHQSDHQLPRKLNLKEVRKNLSQTMQELAEVKRRETDLCREEVQKRQAEINRLESWEQQRKEIKAVLNKIRFRPEFDELNRLDQQCEAIDAEIEELENRLLRLKAQKSRIVAKTDHQRSILIKLSTPASNSLDNLDRTVNTYLRSLLPPSKSPLAAINQFSLERDAFVSKYYEAKREARALRIGAKVWEEVTQVINSFETYFAERVRSPPPAQPTGRASPTLVLKSGLGRRKLANSAAISPSSPPPLSTSPAPQLTADEILESVQLVLDTLETKIQLSQKNGWKLLTCCLIAEYEAYSIAREKLETDMGASRIHARAPDVNLLGDSTVDLLVPKQNAKVEDEDDNLWNQSWPESFSPAQTKPSSPELKKAHPVDGGVKSGNPQGSETDLKGLLDDGLDVSEMEELERTIVVAPEQSNAQNHDKGGYWGDGKLGRKFVAGARPEKPRDSRNLIDFGANSDSFKGPVDFSPLPKSNNATDETQTTQLRNVDIFTLPTIETPGDKVPKEFLDTHSDAKDSNGTVQYVDATDNLVDSTASLTKEKETLEDLASNTTGQKEQKGEVEKGGIEKGETEKGDVEKGDVEKGDVEKGDVEEDEVPEEFLRSKPVDEGTGLERQLAGLNLGLGKGGLL